jgi:hypothetical protein
MDHHAKEKVLDLHAHFPSLWCPASIAYEGWQCLVNGVKILSNPGKAVPRAVFGTKLCTHLTGKNRITQLAFTDIDWDSMELATDLFPPLYQLWVSKHVSGFLGRAQWWSIGNFGSIVHVLAANMHGRTRNIWWHVPVRIVWKHGTNPC